MSISKIKTGLLSYGLSGKIFHAPFVQVHSDFELIAVVERSIKKAKEQFPSIKSYDTIDELLAIDTIELVIVNTPNHTHFDFAMRALQADKHVLVEKPFAVTKLQAQILFETAKSKNRYILPYQNRRYDSDFLSVKKIINSNKLGNIVEMHLRFDRYKNEIGLKKSKEDASIPGSGLLYDLGPHLLDQVISLFGIPLGWKKDVGHFREQTTVDDYAQIQLSYANGLQVYVTVSMHVLDPQAAFVIHGTQGSFIKKRTDVQESQLKNNLLPNHPLYGKETTDAAGILTTIDMNGNINKETVSTLPSSYLTVFDDVYKTIRNGISYPVTEEDIMVQLEILE